MRHRVFALGFGDVIGMEAILLGTAKLPSHSHTKLVPVLVPLLSRSRSRVADCSHTALG
jgi:hypothetical protein